MARSRRGSRTSRKSRKSRKSRRSRGSKRAGSKRTPNRWLKALKKYNQGRSKWIVPKKGTAEYRAVKSIMDKC